MIEKVTAPSAIPVPLGNRLQQFTAVARLVDCTQAKIADDYLVVFVVLAVETSVTNNVVVAFILVNPNLLIRISRVDFFLAKLLGFGSLVNLHRLSLLRTFLCRLLFCLKLACDTLI